MKVTERNFAIFGNIQVTANSEKENQILQIQKNIPITSV